MSDIEGITKEFPELFYENGEPTFYDFSIGGGWIPLVRELFTKMRELGESVKIVQVKQKFGALRVYTDKRSDEINDLIDTYCLKSAKTCEECGAHGKTRKTSTGWFYTSCDEHSKG